MIYYNRGRDIGQHDGLFDPTPLPTEKTFIKKNLDTDWLFKGVMAK